jgi:hypothetical protein
MVPRPMQSLVRPGCAEGGTRDPTPGRADNRKSRQQKEPMQTGPLLLPLVGRYAVRLVQQAAHLEPSRPVDSSSGVRMVA